MLHKMRKSDRVRGNQSAGKPKQKFIGKSDDRQPSRHSKANKAAREGRI